MGVIKHIEFMGNLIIFHLISGHFFYSYGLELKKSQSANKKNLRDYLLQNSMKDLLNLPLDVDYWTVGKQIISPTKVDKTDSHQLKCIHFNV
jgi:hypothetical protein